MSDGDVIRDRIRKKEAEIQSLEERARSARIYVQALEDVLRAIQKVDASEVDSASPVRSGSSVAQAREAILRIGKPVHVSDLLTALGRTVTKEARASLASSLAAYVRRGEVFTRPAPNTFGLLELGHTSDQVAERLEPPPAFGRAAPENDDDIPF